MPKNILFFRHGKSAWNDLNLCDHDRPLAPRGVKAARLMGKFIQDVQQVPDLIITSSAIRTRSTAQIAMKTGEWASQLNVEPRLYGAHYPIIEELVWILPENLSKVMFVGHQPTCSEAISHLTGQINIKFPTAAIAQLKFEGNSWKEVQAAKGQLLWLLPPRLLKHVVKI